MCKYCEYDSEHELDVYQDSNNDSHAYLSEYDGSEWMLTVSDGTDVAETAVFHCPWCGRELI